MELDGFKGMEYHLKNISEFFQEFFSTKEGEKRKQVYLELKQELEQHSSTEERHLFPMIRRELKDGYGISELLISDHIRIGHILMYLDRYDPINNYMINEKFMYRLKVILDYHIEDEKELLNELRSKVSEEDAIQLGKSLKKARLRVSDLENKNWYSRH